MKLLSRSLTAAAVAALPAAALAHPGDHSGMTFEKAIRHLFSEPDHLAMLTVLVLLAAMGGWHILRSGREP